MKYEIHEADCPRLTGFDVWYGKKFETHLCRCSGSRMVAVLANCTETRDGHIGHVEALTEAKAWLDQFEGSYSEGWKVPNGIGTVDETISRSLEPFRAETEER